MKYPLLLIESKSFDKALTFALKVISENSGDTLTLKDVATKMNINYVYLSRIYSKNTNMRFNDLINSFRLTKSINLLKDSKLTISEVSYLCGFGSIRNFNRIFLKEMNIGTSVSTF